MSRNQILFVNQIAFIDAAKLFCSKNDSEDASCGKKKVTFSIMTVY